MNEANERGTLTPIARVSRRFGVAHMMIAVGLFAVLFSLLELFDVPSSPLAVFAYVPCVLFCVAIPLGQVFLYKGRHPRLASCLVGSRLLTFMVVGAFLWGVGPELLSHLLRGRFSFPDGAVLLLLMTGPVVLTHGVGYFLGYAIGTISAGVFLVVDRQWNAGKPDDTETDQPSQEEDVEEDDLEHPTGRWWLDWIAWSPLKWLWRGRRRPLRLTLLLVIVVACVYSLSFPFGRPFVSGRIWEIIAMSALAAIPIVALVHAVLICVDWRTVLDPVGRSTKMNMTKERMAFEVRRVSPFKPAPPPKRVPIMGVPRNFATGHLLAFVTLFALMFSLLSYQDANPAWYVAWGLFITGVILGQMFLYGGKEPRLASCIAGAIAAPVSFDVAVAMLAHPEPAWGDVIAVAFGSAIPAAIIGVGLGYLTGTVCAGIFLLTERAWDAGKIVEDEPSVAKLVSDETEGQPGPAKQDVPVDDDPWSRD